MLQLSEIQDLHKKSATLFPFSNGFGTNLLSLRVKNVVIGNASTPTKTADTTHMEIFASLFPIFGRAWGQGYRHS